MKNYKKVIILSFLLLFPSVLYIFLATGRPNFNHLPFYGPRKAIRVMKDGKEKTDTLYYSVPPFSFIAQNGKTVSDEFFNGRIYLISFFYSRCSDHCPEVNTRLYEVQKQFSLYDSVNILSCTVDPGKDSIQALATYGEKLHANPDKWFLARGEKMDVYRFASHALLMNEMKDTSLLNHKCRMVLVDKQGRIRGYYEGAKAKEPAKLTDDIKVLIAESMIPKKKKKRKI